MLSHTQKACPFARVVHGFAEDAPLHAVLGAPPDRILFSYCLSMVQDPTQALKNALAAVAPGGEVVVVDFGDFKRVSTAVREPFLRFLATFHVHPVAADVFESCGASPEFGPFHYSMRVRLRPTA